MELEEVAKGEVGAAREAEKEYGKPPVGFLRRVVGKDIGGWSSSVSVIGAFVETGRWRTGSPSVSVSEGDTGDSGSGGIV